MVTHVRLPSLEDLPPERRRTTVAALRRGDIKVSDPVPMENSGPSPIWKTSHPPTDSVMGFTPSDAAYSHPQPDMAALDDVFSHNSGLAEDPSQSRQKRSSALSSDREHHTQNHSAAGSSQPRSSTVDSDTMGSPSTKKKRRSGSIRSAFRRMFSKREKTAPNRGTPPVNQPRHEYHKSDTAIMTGTALASLKEEGFRSRDRMLLNRNETDDKYHSNPPMAAPQLPFPMNVNAPQTSPPYPNYTSFESSPHVHRRRATLPSVILSPTEAAALTKYWTAENPGSAVDATRDLARTPTPLIGLAITSGSNPNRRSRSADALRELAQKQMPEMRRRSAEIQYWRSANHGIPEVEEADTFARSESASIKHVTHVSSPSLEHVPNVALNGSPHKKGGQASSLSSSSEQALNQFEAKDHADLHSSPFGSSSHQFSRSMEPTNSQEQLQAFRLDKAPKGARTPSGLPSTPRGNPIRDPSVTHHSSSPSTISQEDSHPPSSHNNGGTPPVPSFSVSKEPSDSQHQPQLAHPQIHNFSSPITPTLPSPKGYDNLAPVYNALRYERAVRKQLENQVLQLQRDLLQLTTVVAEMRGVHAYPFTPSPDNVVKGDCIDEMVPEDWRLPRDRQGVGSGWRGEMF